MYDSSFSEIQGLSDWEVDNQISLLPRLTKTSIGTRIDGDSLIVEADEPHGWALNGPLCSLATGLYRLDIRCSAGLPKAPNLPILGVEVVATSKGPQAWRDFTADELKYERASISFFVSPDSDIGTKFNFKFYHFGNSTIEITSVNLIRTAAHDGHKKELRTWRLLGLLRARKIATRHRDGTVSVKQRSHPECFLDGPSAFILTQGYYQLKFSCSARATRLPEQPVLGVEVVVWDSGQSKHLLWRDLTTEELESGPVTIDFAVPSSLTVRSGRHLTFSFAFFHLGNSDLAVRSVELSEMAEDVSHASHQAIWRLLGRLQKRWRPAGILNGSTGRNAALARWIVHGIRPHLKLPVGSCRVQLEASAVSRTGSTRPAMRVEVVVQGVWSPPEMLRPLFQAMRWRLRGIIATVATCQFNESELNAGECVLDFAVPFEWSIDSGANFWFDLRLVRLSNAAINIKDVRISATTQHQDAHANSTGESSPKKTSFWNARKAVMVVGNCQAQFVGHQLQALPLLDRFSVNHHFCELPNHEIETGKRLISNAEIVLVQDIRDWERYPLKDYVQNTAQIIKFPCLRFASLWPFDSLNGPGDPEALNRDGPALKFPHLDGALARLRREIPDPELRLARYAALEMKLMVDPGRLHEFELQRLLAMDQKFQFEIGQFILDNFRHQRLFYATGHPRGKLFEMLLDRLFRSLEIKGFVPTGRELDRQLEGIEIPVHPMVGNILGVKWATERARYLYEGEQVTWEIYVRRYIDYYG